MKARTRMCAAILMMTCGIAAAAPFTFQGELREGGAPIDGVYDLRFGLFPADFGGTQIGVSQCVDNVQVVDGRFSVVLDFGDTAFPGADRYLEIAVRVDTGVGCSSNAGFTTMSGRAQVTPAPIASFALQAATATLATNATTATNATNLNGHPQSYYENAANLVGILGDGRLSTNIPKYTNAVNSFDGTVSALTFSGSGAGLTTLNASGLSSGTVADARLSSNIPRLNTPNTFTAGLTALSFSGSGALLTGLNAANLTSGTVGDARLSSNVALRTGTNVFSGSNTFSSVVNMTDGLAVQGTISSGGTATTGLFVRNPTNNVATAGLEWASDVARLRVGGVGTGALNGLDIQGSSSTSLLRVLNDGRVGVGTASPVARMQVFNGPSGGSPSSFAELVLEDNADSWLQILTPDVNDRGLALGSASNGFMAGMYYNNSTGMSLRTGGNLTRMTITPTGDVGIGTTTPDAKLEVAGPAGNSTVLLPDSSIAAAEILDEAGVAFRHNITWHYVENDETPVTLATRTITAPAAGYVVILATCNCERHDIVSGTFRIQVREGTTFNGSEPSESADFEGRFAAATEHINITIQRVVPVTAGPHTFTLLAESTQTNGEAHMAVGNQKMTLMYFPSAFGTVDE